MSEPAQTPAPTGHPSAPRRAFAVLRRLRWIVIAIVAVLVLVFFIIPFGHTVLTTVSTDDAYVNGHVTFVAARIPDQVVNVLVDDNNRVRKGDVLVQLDKTPYQIRVEVAKAALETAKANLAVAGDEVRGMVATA